MALLRDQTNDRDGALLAGCLKNGFESVLNDDKEHLQEAPCTR